MVAIIPSLTPLSRSEFFLLRQTACVVVPDACEAASDVQTVRLIGET